MYNLLSANLSRLWINKAFWLSVAITACAEGIFCLLLSMQGPVPMDVVLFVFLQGNGILTSVFFSLFLGTEYSDGTIRNKLIFGHKRTSVYFAGLITGIIAVTIIYLTGILTGGVLGITLFAPSNYGIGQIALAAVIGWLSCVSYIAIFNLVGMLSSSKSKTSIICMLTAFILIFTGLVCFSLLNGSENVFIKFLLDFNPFGQTMQTMSIVIASPRRLAAYSLLLSLVTTGLGVYVFRKKDLK